jgi:hypothetical protein
VRVTVVRRPDIVSRCNKWPGVELSFPQRPTIDIRLMIGPRILGGVGFRWHGRGYRNEQGEVMHAHGYWYAFSTPAKEEVVQILLDMGDTIEADTELTTEVPKWLIEKRARLRALKVAKDKAKEEAALARRQSRYIARNATSQPPPSHSPVSTVPAPTATCGS